MPHRILLVEDDDKLGRQVAKSLRDAGLAVDWIQDGGAAFGVSPSAYSLLILDLMLPGKHGLDVLEHLRADSDVPVLVLSARNDTTDKVRALELGADDYLTKPFWPEELLARVKARLRRPALERDGVIAGGGLTVDCNARTVLVHEVAIELTRVEFDLLVALARRPVRRIRRLAADVRRVATERYVEPVIVRGAGEIAQLATAFNDAGAEVRSHLESLEERDRTLRAFVANTTHDVMLPLTVLQGHLSALRDRADAGTPVEREVVTDAMEEAHYLASLVANLGAAVKLEAGAAHIHRHPVDLSELVERVAGRQRPIARQRGIRIELSLPGGQLWTAGDVTLIEQAVSNLAHNAVRYHDHGGRVELRLAATECADSSATFSLRVVDDGPGLSDEALARVAERSFRTDEARRRHPEGLGLGLHNAQSVALAHGVELEIRRTEPRGLEVELRGPLASPTDEAPAA